MNDDVATLVVDGQVDVRVLMRMAIETANDGLRVAGEAADGMEAVEQWEHLRPDVIALDHMMPRMTGLDAAAEIRRRRPDQAIVMFSAFLGEELQRRAAELGVWCCLPKEDIQALPGALRALASNPDHRC